MPNLSLDIRTPAVQSGSRAVSLGTDAAKSQLRTRPTGFTGGWSTIGAQFLRKKPEPSARAVHDKMFKVVR